MSAHNDLRADIRAVISNAFYDARNAGLTMEHAADAAADKVMDALAIHRYGPRAATPGAIVAYYMPHNEGVESGIIDGPGFTSGGSLVDLYEVDGVIRSFETREAAEDWLTEQAAETDAGEPDRDAVTGGYRLKVEYE